MLILNTHTLKKLFSCIQPADQLELLQTLLLELPKDAQQLQHEISQGNLHQIKNQAHRIKGAYSNLGCDALCSTMQAFETPTQTIKLDIHLQTNIAEQFQQTQDAIHTYVSVVAQSSHIESIQSYESPRRICALGNDDQGCAMTD